MIIAMARFEEMGLPDGMRGEHERSARVELLEHLMKDGVSLEEMRAAVNEDRLATLPTEVVIRRDCRHALEQVSRTAGIDRDFIIRDLLALGLPRPEPDAPYFTDAALEAYRQVPQLLDAGLSEEDLLRIARVLGRASAQIAQVTAEVFIERFLDAGETEKTLALRLADLAAVLLPAIGPQFQYPLAAHLRQVVRREAVSQAELDAGRPLGHEQLSVGFVDLVSFTTFSEQASTERLGELTARFESVAAEAATPPVRLVKLIGDAAMFVSPDPRTLVDAVARMLNTSDRDPLLPSMRAGIAVGPILQQGGDYYGNTVNLASRITDHAPQGGALATTDVVEATADHHHWDSGPSAELKGMSEPVQLHRLTRATAGRGPTKA